VSVPTNPRAPSSNSAASAFGARNRNASRVKVALVRGRQRAQKTINRTCWLRYNGWMTVLRNTAAIVMSAGLGTRMRSALPKALFQVCGRPLVFYPVAAAIEAGASEVVVVVGHGRDAVSAYLQNTFGARVRTAVQEQQLGTGDAARAGLHAVSSDAERILIANGDTPLVMAQDFQKIFQALEADPYAAMALATCELAEPFGYGRVLRNADGHVVAIREQRDTTSDAERAVREINPGIYGGARAFFAQALASLRPNNAQGEYYLTDVVAFAQSDTGGRARVLAVPARAEVMEGINDRAQLAQAELTMATRIISDFRRSGVTVREGARIDHSVQIAQDVTIESGVILRGTTRIATGAFVDVGSILTNVIVGEGAQIRPYTVAHDSVIGESAQVGPFSHLRPASVLGPESHVGNFVELKKTTLGRGSKANHLAYLGDGIIGEHVNIGAGTIFCNYDGVKKHTTTIEDGVFVGSDSQIVAPVTLGKGAYIATGTTVTRNVPADALAIGRVAQDNKEGYAARLRARMKNRGSP
jgi:bifunctional UDP-N-acetylglucosamine pyrophosphorylase / glucosamine-1-phosphate N-acetyltransferase